MLHSKCLSTERAMMFEELWMEGNGKSWKRCKYCAHARMSLNRPSNLIGQLHIEIIILSVVFISCVNQMPLFCVVVRSRLQYQPVKIYFLFFSGWTSKKNCQLETCFPVMKFTRLLKRCSICHLIFATIQCMEFWQLFTMAHRWTATAGRWQY